MGKCRRVKLLFRIVPVVSLQSALIRRHLLSCSRCSEDAADLEEARAAILPPEKIGPRRDHWPAVSRRLDQAEKTIPGRRFRQAWRWAFATAGLLAVLAVVLWNRFPRRPEADPFAGGLKLKIHDLRVYEQPAQAFIFQTQDADRTFVWVEQR